jgi:hypothetical protein
MEAQVWTLIGLLAATLFGSFFYLGSRIDGLESSLSGRIDGLGGRIDGLHGRMDALERNLRAEIRAQGRELGERIYEVSVKLDDHLRRHAG